MTISDRVQLAYEALRRQKMRSVLTAIAVSIGIASVVIIVSAGQGLEHMVVGELDIYNPNTLNIEVRVPGKGGVNLATSMASGVSITTLKNTDMDEIKKHPNIDFVYNYVTSQQVIQYQGEHKTVTVFGYGADAPYVEHIEFLEGGFYNSDDEDGLSQVIVLGSDVKDELFGSDTALSKRVFIKGSAYRVVGVQIERGASFGFDYDTIVYIPTKTLQKRLLGTDYAMGINARVIDMTHVDETKEDIEILLRERHDISDPDRDDFEVTTMADIRETLDTVVGGITLLLIALVCISLLVGGVGITNIMYVTVAERTFEIGLRKSLGAKQSDILWQFLLEAVLLTFLGGVIGVVFGYIVSFLIYIGATSFGLSWVFSVPLYAIIISIVFSSAIGLFFAVYPAKKAASLNPIAALRKES